MNKTFLYTTAVVSGLMMAPGLANAQAVGTDLGAGANVGIDANVGSPANASTSARSSVDTDANADTNAAGGALGAGVTGNADMDANADAAADDANDAKQSTAERVRSATDTAEREIDDARAGVLANSQTARDAAAARIESRSDFQGYLSSQQGEFDRALVREKMAIRTDTSAEAQARRDALNEAQREYSNLRAEYNQRLNDMSDATANDLTDLRSEFDRRAAEINASAQASANANTNANVQ